jgi:hypothetical protein
VSSARMNAVLEQICKKISNFSEADLIARFYEFFTESTPKCLLLYILYCIPDILMFNHPQKPK